MIRLGLRCVPAQGRHDLAWLARLTGSLLEIYEFLLRSEIGARLAADRDRRALSADEQQLVIEGQAIEAGSPLVKLRGGSTRVELGAQTTLPLQTLSALALVLESGPEVAAWPGYLKQAWYGEGTQAARARQAYEWIRGSVDIRIVEGRSKKRRQQPADLPFGVRVAPPL
jgi:hypothetical protein